MLTATQIGGFIGAGLAGAAYVPQIFHLIRARCSAGISQLAFGVWLLSSLLITARAVAIGAGVFIVLGAIQIVATALIVVCAARYKNTPCPVHRPASPRSGPPPGRARQEPSLVPGVWPVARLLNQLHPPRTVGYCARTPQSGTRIPTRPPNFN